MRRSLPFVLVLAAIGACTFPDASYVDSGVEGDGSGSSSGSMSSSSSGSSSGTDASSSSSGGDGSTGSSSGDASVDRSSGDARGDVNTMDGSSSSSGSGSSSGGPPCDMDNDGYMAKSCGGNDCCDTDANAHPMQTMFFPTKDACNSFDYNCNGTQDPEYGNSLSCTGIPATGCNDHCAAVSPCSSGFLGADPGCGNTASFGTCQPDSGNLACVATATGPQQQLCN